MAGGSESLPPTRFQKTKTSPVWIRILSTLNMNKMNIHLLDNLIVSQEQDGKYSRSLGKEDYNYKQLFETINRTFLTNNTTLLRSF